MQEQFLGILNVRPTLAHAIDDSSEEQNASKPNRGRGGRGHQNRGRQNYQRGRVDNMRQTKGAVVSMANL